MSTAVQPTAPVEIFYSYAHEDEALREELEKHLALLRRQGVLTEWHDRDITAGDEWKGQIDAHLNSAQLILLLVSPDFLASDYCYDIEMQRAMARHATGEARVIPIILRPVAHWQSAAFGKLQALPRDGKPVTTWDDRDQAFAEVADGIRRAIQGNTTSEGPTDFPSQQTEAPDIHSLSQGLVARIQGFFVRLFGPRLGRLLATLLMLSALVWWQWDKIKDLPGVQSVLTWISRESLTAIPADTYVVAVAHLEGDGAQHETEDILVNTLRNLEPGIRVRRIDRTISLSGPGFESDKEQQGHDQARAYLQDIQAHILLWGTVLTSAGKQAPQLYVTTDTEKRRAKEVYQAENFKLPLLFSNEITDVLRLLVLTQGVAFSEGQYLVDQLVPFISKVQHLLETSAEHRGWTPAGLADVKVLFADALSMLGQQSGENKPVEQAVVAYQEALKEHTRERVPLQWATTQNNLGLALWRLGERESGTARLEQAVVAYQEALKERTRERVPLDWATTQSNLSNALQTLGGRESGTARLEQAVAAYQEALKEYTRTRVPLDWATTQNNLGAALQTLGGRESGTARLEQAVAAYQEALKERTRERVPLDWAMTQNNLGAALRTLGGRGSGTARLEQAVAAYQEALKEYTRERVPLQWATTQNNLGNALQTLGERESGTARLEQAVAAYQEALKERTHEHVPLQWATTQNNLGNALQTLGERKKHVSLLCDALDSHLNAWRVFSPTAHYSTTIAMNGVKNDIATLHDLGEPESVQACLTKYKTLLQQVDLSTPVPQP